MFFKRLYLFPVLVLSLFGIQICLADGLDRFDSPDSWQEDAELTDVFFLNDLLGWAVGAQGTILRTVDGGNNWATISTVPQVGSEGMNLNQKLRSMRPLSEVDQLKPVRCRFETVFFANPKTGWIAGGYEYPYVNRTRAVVMKTNDGGLTWNQIGGLVLPRIIKIRFENELNGWAIGDRSNLYQTGIYTTSDGGHSWSSQSRGRLQNWLAGVATADGFVLLDELNRLSKVKSDQSEFSVVLDKTESHIRDLVMLDNERGLAVGDAGAILKTDNGGTSWNCPSQLDLPLLKHFDFRSVTDTTDKFWVVGYPGTRVVSIDKRTGRVTHHPTPVIAPLNRVVFADEKHGWAVGSLGAIIATRDGGQSWHRQRGRSRVALLNVFESEQHAALELMARYACEEDLLTANLVLAGLQKERSKKDSGQAPKGRTMHQAAERLGASYSMEIRMIPNREQENLESLVRTIRTMQPNVISTSSNPRVQSLVAQAVQHAAQRDSFELHSKSLGLEPWQVDRIALESEQGQLVLDRRRLLARTGQLLEDQVAVSRALLGLDFQMEKKRTYRVVNISTASQSTHRELLGGLAGFGKEIPARTEKGRRGNLGVIRHTSQKQKAMDQLSQWQIETPQQALQWRKQIQNWIGFLQPETAGIWVSQLAQRYLEQGQPELAAMAMELIANRWPKHAMGPSSMIWLIRYYGSSEFAQIAYRQSAHLRKLVELEKSSSSVGTTTMMREGNVVKSVWTPVSQDKLSGQDQELTIGTEEQQPATGYEQFIAGRQQKASLFLSRLRQRDPDLVLEPEFRFVEARLTQQQHGWLPIANLMKQLSKRMADHPTFALAALREIQIQDEQQNPVQMLVAVRARERPFLDGKMDDPVWENAARSGKMISQPAAQTETSEPDLIGLAYDNEFLYVFARHQKIQGQGYNGRESKPTLRDPELTRRDRIEFRIDTDRDYCTSMNFSIDHRGWASESCAGCVGWNPDWFVAQSQDEESWSVELAIPLERISGTVPTQGDIWAIDVRRLSYDSSPLWQPGVTSGRSARERDNRGLQAGLRAHPGEFQLLEFE